MLRKITGSLLLLCMMPGIRAQNTIRIGGGTKLTINGNVQLVLGGGNLINNGTISGSTGTLVFAAPINFSGTGFTQVPNLIVSHSPSVVSILNAPLDITNTATIMFGNLNFNDNLVIRSDISTTANLVVSGTPTGSVEGLIARGTPAYGPCPSFPSVLSVNISGPLLNYQWQKSTDSLAWSDISGATAHNYNAVIDGTIYYRCHVTSGSSFDELLPAGKLGLDTVTNITGVTTVATGSTASLTSVTGGGTWSSSNPSVLTIDPSTGFITGIHTGTATVTYAVSNINACTRNTTTVITVTPGNKPVVVITNPASVCAPATIDLTTAAIIAGSDPNLTYTYYSDATATTTISTPNKITTGATYYIVGTNTAGASSDAMPVVVSIVQAQNIKAAFTFDSYCINNAVLFTNTSTTGGPVTYQWSDNTGKSSALFSPSFTYTTTGNVTMKLKVSSVTCPLVADSITQVIAVEQPAPAIRMQKVTVGLGETMELRARNFGASYIWTPVTGLSNTLVFNPKVNLTSQEQEYKISIKAASGCVTVDTLLVQIFDKRIYVANVFTPNGDGVNDKLLVNVIGTNLRQLVFFRVYNRYSKLVFETTDATIGWDGKVNGVLQPMDTYIWVAEAKDSNGSVVTRSGNVTLLR